MGEINYLAIFKESFTLVILSFCSVLSITFAFERWWAFKKAGRGKTDELLSHLHKAVHDGDIEKAAVYAKKTDSSKSRLLRVAIENRHMKRVHLDEMLSTSRQEERLHLENYLNVLGTMGNIAPFIGLFGTVIGIIKAFRDLALSGVGGPTVVARGIAEALVATAAGLAVAIPAVIVYNYFMRRLKVIMTELEVFSTRLAIMLEK